MPGKTYPVIQKKLELKSKALEANREELPHLETHRGKIDGVLGEVKDLTVQQTSRAPFSCLLAFPTGVRFYSTSVRLNLTAERLSLAAVVLEMTQVRLDLTGVRFHSTGVRLNLTAAGEGRDLHRAR